MQNKKRPVTASGLHIGEMLKAYIDRKKIYKSVIARKMNCSDSNILKLQKGKSITTESLMAFCHALKHNFFRDIADQLPPQYSIEKPADTSKDGRIAELELENTVLRAEKEVLLKALQGR